MERKVAIITGGSSGIGKALAIKYAKEHYAVIIAARHFDTLKEVEQLILSNNGMAHAVACDVKNQKDCENLIASTIQKFGRIDVLINNAGISMRSAFSETDPEVVNELMQVNFMGAVYCTRYAINHINKHKGSIIGISSIAGYRGLPGRTGYSASKFALRGFLQSLRLENRKKNLHVMEASPGYTQSNIRKNALTKDGTAQGDTPLKEENIMTAEKVAEMIYKAMLKRKERVIMTFEGRMIVWLSEIIPRLVDYLIYKNVSREKGSPF